MKKYYFLMTLIFIICSYFYFQSCSNNNVTQTNQDCEITCSCSTDYVNTINWSGFTWGISNSHDKKSNPGCNYWSDDASNVWVDASNNLHLKITNRNGKWYCVDLESSNIVNYGEYDLYLETDIAGIDGNVVLGFYTWNHDNCTTNANSELDIEFTKAWGSGYNTFFSVQPTENGTYTERRLQFENYNTSSSLHRFSWNPNLVKWESYKNQNYPPSLGDTVRTFIYDLSHDCRKKYDCNSQCIKIPNPENNTRIHLNLWLNNHVAPGNEVEVVIKKVVYIPSIPSAGLVAYYPFNGNANDESGNGNHGTVVGAVLTNDRFNNPNKAYFFDNPLRGFTQGNTNLINCGHGSSLQLTNAVSISLWFNASTTDVSGSYLISKASTQPAGYEYSIEWDYWSGGSGLKSDAGGVNPDEIGTNFFPNANTWYHAVITWEYPGNYKIYINGSLLKTQTTSHLIAPTSQDVVVGCIRPSGEPSIRYFDGKIDDIRIFNRALTDAEINQLYHEGGW